MEQARQEAALNEKRAKALQSRQGDHKVKSGMRTNSNENVKIPPPVFPMPEDSRRFGRPADLTPQRSSVELAEPQPSQGYVRNEIRIQLIQDEIERRATFHAVMGQLASPPYQLSFEQQVPQIGPEISRELVQRLWAPSLHAQKPPSTTSAPSNRLAASTPVVTSRVVEPEESHTHNIIVRLAPGQAPSKKRALDAEPLQDSKRVCQGLRQNEQPSTNAAAANTGGDGPGATQVPPQQTMNAEASIDNGGQAVEGETKVISANTEAGNVEIKVLVSRSGKVTTTVYKEGEKVQEFVVE